MKSKFLVAILSLFFLTACEFQAFIDLSFSHVMRVANSRSEQGIPSKGIIRLEMAGMDSCLEKKGKVVEILSRYYGEPESHRCQQEELSTFLEARVPVAVKMKGLERNNQITSMLLESDDRGLHLRVAMDRGSFERMQDEMMDAFFQKPEVKDLEMVIRFKNDSKATLVGKARFVYVDGKPLPMESKVLLDPGRSIEVRLSDVARDYIYNEGSLTVFTIESTVEGKPFAELEFAEANSEESIGKDPESSESERSSGDRNATDSPGKDIHPGLQDKDFPKLERAVEEMMKRNNSEKEPFRLGGS
ncbi:MAG: hypothetical protein CMN76_03530 [Spirochaetaceae bacterium]|nr:hypothetical protein [Spirochaetaceae bacterium]|tara:strand:- start:162898 stop:163806 length:909 start_codon:yes stop_codon:yes gene_type:complete